MRRTDTTPDAEEIRFDILRRLTGNQRVQMAVEMTEEANDICRAGIAFRHPEYSPEDVQLAFVRLRLGEDLFREVKPTGPFLEP